MYIVACVVSGTCHPISANDTIRPVDSAEVYRNIEAYSKKNEFAKFIYPLVFRPVKVATVKKRRPVLQRIPYGKFGGKIIRAIPVVTVEPFAYLVNDTAFLSQNILFRVGNTLHVKTQKLTIENLLLFGKNDVFDSLLVKESERLVRGQNYVRDVLFRVVPVAGSDDSVDIQIRVADRWSITPGGDITSTRATIGLTENNFAGLGHEFQNTYSRNYSNGTNAFSTHYFVPNIRNTHIGSSLGYLIDEYDNEAKSMVVERPFYSPLAQWAAGLSIGEVFLRDTATGMDSGYVRQNLLGNTQDYWAGFAHRIFAGNAADERTTNAIIAGRYLRIRFPQRPDELHDPLRLYSHEDLYLSGLGISTREYVNDRYIFNFGATEDVPVGRVFGITGGWQVRNNIGRLYAGARISFGDYTDWGYVSSTLECGSFFLQKSPEQGVLAAGFNYFSKLSEIGNWRIRQFVKPQVIWGIKRSSADSLTMNGKNGIRGLSSLAWGTKKIVVTLQTQSYAPWNVLGFRFGPYMTCSLGMLGNQSSGFDTSPLYSQIGIGALIKNEYLILSDFQLSIAYYPAIPGSGDNMIKINAFKTADFGFRDFNLGKPQIVVFE